MKCSPRFLSYLIVIAFSVLLSNGCVPLRKTLYLQDATPDSTRTSFQAKPYQYRLQPGDYLYIRMMSLDEKTNQLFSNIIGTTANSIGNQNLYLTSYMINDSGFVMFPVIGKVPAAGSTVEELESRIHAEISKYVKEASVVVKQVNFMISVLGEVGQPGQFTINKDRVNILEAITLAGDLRTFANRNSVKIIRHTQGKTDIYTVDLTRKDLLESDLYLLKPNDIVYVEPLKGKQFAFETFPYAMVFSTISFLLVLATYFTK